MQEIDWGNVRDSLVATGIWVVAFAILGRSLPYFWALFSQRLRPWIWKLNSRIARSLYVKSFVSALKREAEAKSRVRTSKTNRALALLISSLLLLLFLCIFNASMYIELIYDIAILLEYSVGNQESAEDELKQLLSKVIELEEVVMWFHSHGTRIAFVCLVGFMALFEAIQHTAQQFRASLEIELQRINEYIRVLASKSELSDLARLECAVCDSVSAGAYIKRINEIAARHGLEGFDKMFPIVKFLRRLAPDVSDD